MAFLVPFGIALKRFTQFAHKPTARGEPLGNVASRGMVRGHLRRGGQADRMPTRVVRVPPSDGSADVGALCGGQPSGLFASARLMVGWGDSLTFRITSPW